MSIDTATATLEELAAHLGLDAEALAKVIERAGSEPLAKRKLKDRIEAAHRKFEQELENRRAEARAAAGRERHARYRSIERIETLHRRATSTLGQRLTKALHELTIASTCSAGNIAASARTTASSNTPPAQALPAIGWRIEAIRYQVERLELELDAIHGLQPATELTGDQKDAVIVHRFAGVHSKDVASALPELGSQRTIERARERANVRPTTGLPLEPRN